MLPKQKPPEYFSEREDGVPGGENRTEREACVATSAEGGGEVPLEPRRFLNPGAGHAREPHGNPPADRMPLWSETFFGAQAPRQQRATQQQAQITFSEREDGVPGGETVRSAI